MVLVVEGVFNRDAFRRPFFFKKRKSSTLLALYDVSFEVKVLCIISQELDPELGQAVVRLRISSAVHKLRDVDRIFLEPRVKAFYHEFWTFLAVVKLL